MRYRFQSRATNLSRGNTKSQDMPTYVTGYPLAKKISKLAFIKMGHLEAS
jgi:hypothetical protein